MGDLKPRGGLDFLVYEGGTNLSLGERQLLSMARVFVFDPPVIILDEATSSIDRIIERKLVKAIQEVMGHRTSIVIAHRLETTKQCKNILVLEEGRVVEWGKEEDLIAKVGVYANFHDLHLTLRSCELQVASTALLSFF